MRKLISVLTILFLTCSISAQELVDFHIGKGGLFDVKFQKKDSFYYQVGIFNDAFTVGFDSEAQVISEIGSNKKDQIYVVKYDLNYKIVWATAIGLTNGASRVQMKFFDDYLYIFWPQVNVDKVFHYCHRININDPEDIDYVLRFETGLGSADYDFEISNDGALAIAGNYRDRIKFSFTGQADEEYFCNSEQNIFLVRYRFLSEGYSYSHIVQREWGNPGTNKRYYYTLKFDENENLHLFGGGSGSVQLDGNLGIAIGQSTPFQLTYSETNELIQFKKTDVGFFEPPMLIPIGNNRHALVGTPEYTILDENLEIISSRNFEYLSDVVVDVAVSDESFTALYEVKSSIHPRTINGYTIVTRSLDYALINYDFEGNMNWYAYFGGDSQSEIPISVDYLDNGNLVVCGNTNDNLDLDPSHNVVKYGYQFNRFFVAEYSTECNGLSTGIKSISQINCNENAQLEFGINGGTSPYQFYFNNQLVTNFDDIEVTETGVYEAHVIDGENCSKSIYVPITGPSLDPNEKLDLHQYASEFRTGFEAHISYALNNKNCIPRSGKIKIILDDQIEFESASLTPSLVNDQILEFEYNDLIYEDAIFRLRLDLRISQQAAFGNHLCARIYIYDAQGTEIDRDIICKEVINSYDPNDISVSPYGRCDENYFLMDEELEYTIRFQNLGNAEAINIEIVDTLSAAFDINSFVQTATSHNATVHIAEDSILIIHFKDIELPAEIQDEEGSNGFFSYKINTTENQGLNTKIDNRAAIYFDFNDPVITNTVRSTLIDNLPVCILTNVKDIEDNALIYYPNPAVETLTIEHGEFSKATIKLFDISAKHYNVPMTELPAKTVLDLSRLSSGIYFVKVAERVFRFYKE